MINKAGREGLKQELVDFRGNLVGYNPKLKQVSPLDLDENGRIKGTLATGRVGVAESAVNSDGSVKGTLSDGRVGVAESAVDTDGSVKGTLPTNRVGVAQSAVNDDGSVKGILVVREGLPTSIPANSEVTVDTLPGIVSSRIVSVFISVQGDTSQISSACIPILKQSGSVTTVIVKNPNSTLVRVVTTVMHR